MAHSQPSSDASRGALPGHEKPYQVFEDEILQSPNDVFKCRYLVLANGLRVLVASDPAAEEAAAALCVGAGGLADPDEIPGLAHFCEHMLFMVPSQTDASLWC
jgi:secreted Zn-dependent insulinase-like peptidase